MKRSQVFALFYIGTPLLLLARCLQRFYMIDSETGFYADGFAGAGAVITGAYLVFTAVVLLLFRLDGTQRVAMPQRSVALAAGAFVASAFLAVSVVTRLLTESGTASSLTAIAGALFALCLVWRGLGLCGATRYPAWMAPVGTFYALIRLIVRFASYSGEVTVSDTLFDILTMCLLVLFFFCEGKLTVGISSKRLPAVFGACGLCGALFCISEFVPALVDRLLQSGVAFHGAGLPDPAYIGFAAYLLIAVHAVKPEHSA